MKLISLLKAVFSQDMSLFKYKNKSKNKLSKIMMLLFLFAAVSCSVGFYIYVVASALHDINQTHLVLSMMVFVVTIIAFMEGIYKSQNMLFDCKDNDLLFSLPIKKESILFVRIVKLLVFEYLFNLMFLLPTFVVYISFMRPGVLFYIMSFLMTILIPIIPTVLSCFVGYEIKRVTSKSKKSKLVQTILTLVAFVVFFFFITEYETMVEDIAAVVAKQGDKFNYYYPIRAYLELINKFNIVTFIKLLLLNIIPFVLFILIAKRHYFNIISNSKNTYKKNTKGKVSIVVRKPLISLTIKELKRYFSSTVYMFNTAFGFILVFMVSIAGLFVGKQGIIDLFKTYEISDKAPIEMIVYVLVFIALSMTSISSSSISMEGRTINMTKSLPVDYADILKSKILSCLVIELPLIIISIILFTIGFRINIIYFICFILLSIVIIFLNANIGLLVNLKHAKLVWNNDTEVVKQSYSSMVSVLLAFPIMIVGGLALLIFCKMYNDLFAMFIHILLMFIVSMILYVRLMNIGPKRYSNLSV